MRRFPVAPRTAFSDEKLEQLRGFPEVNHAELIRHFTLTPADEMFVRKFRGQGNVLGAAVQLCTLPWLGLVPSEVASAPAAAVARLADRLETPSARCSGRRVRTRSAAVRRTGRRRRHLGLDSICAASQQAQRRGEQARDATENEARPAPAVLADPAGDRATDPVSYT